MRETTIKSILVLGSAFIASSLFATSSLAIDLLATTRSNFGSLDSIDQTSGQPTRLGQIGFPIRDLAGDTRPAYASLWGVGLDGNRVLIQIDPIDQSVVSSVELLANEAIATLAIDPTTGTMFGTSESVGETSLFQIDRLTGSTAVVGDMGTPLTSLGFDQTGRLFGSFGSSLFEIDPTNAAVTVVSSALPVFRLDDLASRPADNKMFALGQGVGYRLFGIDVSSGIVEDIGPSLGRPSGLGFFVPEPNSALLVVVWALVYLRRLASRSYH